MATVKDALAKWEEKIGEKACDQTHVMLYGQNPPIERMDASIATLANCEQLSLSTNRIKKITNLHGLKNLRILSLGRNCIKDLSGLEPVRDTLEELWISYNSIEKMDGIQNLKKMSVLYMSNNQVKDWGEFSKMADLPSLSILVFQGNPLQVKHAADGTWREEAIKRLPNLNKLDGYSTLKK
ncbi:dynein axonemal light chain 1-like isoform X2 [Synchiropus splendidus]|uniref:dynein axonemal light chain 1-like isoform X2 n=1 Tax=Synchiropus splendidus TaxID=270530 RepID=UPI00237DB8CE|nr:dynein axonemal light chain 1-like isoform X2 [Synchiropus splendidus]